MRSMRSKQQTDDVLVEEKKLTVDDFCQSIETRMRAGLFSVTVLHVINSSKRPIHGYLITKSISELTDGNIHIQAGTLYPILKNLELHGLIVHEMVRSTGGPPRKVYTITRDGRKGLKRLVPEMDRLFEAILLVRKTDWKAMVEDQVKK